MTPAERQDLTQFNATARQRVAAAVSCSIHQVRACRIQQARAEQVAAPCVLTRPLQVDDCIAKYNWMKSMTAALALRRQQGKPAPRSVEEMESMLGNWRSHKQEHMQVQPPGQAAPGETDLPAPH